MKRILLVEDNADDIELAVRAFRGTNPTLEIDIAHDGPEALAALLAPMASPHPPCCRRSSCWI
jgi:CheY-like chemotaxis protein